jgi:hypothetical protein
VACDAVFFRERAKRFIGRDRILGKRTRYREAEQQASVAEGCEHGDEG